jgi:nitrous oxidase accessory protein NosD
MAKSIVNITILLTFSLLSGCSGEDGNAGKCCTADCYYKIEGAGEKAIYVNKACVTGKKDGSIENPFGSFSEALKEASDGVKILIGEGDYQEDSNIYIDKSVSIFGMGKYDEALKKYVDKTVITCSKDNVVAIVNTKDVTIRGLTIKEPKSAGIVVQDADNISLLENHILQAKMNAKKEYGFGIAVSSGKGVRIEQNFVEQCDNIGIYSANAISIIVRNTVMLNREGIRLSECFIEAGLADEIEEQKVEISGNTIEENYDSGIKVLSSTAEIYGNTIRGTKPLSGDQLNAADGLVAGKLIKKDEKGNFIQTQNSRVWIGRDEEGKDNRIEGNGRTGMLFTDEAAIMIIVRNHVFSNLDRGIWIQGGSIADKIIKNEVTENKYTGIGLTTDSRANIGSESDEDKNTIAGTKKSPYLVSPEIGTQLIGDGIGIFHNSSGIVSKNKIEKNERAGIITDHAKGKDNETRITGNTIAGSEVGIVVQGQEQGNEIEPADNIFGDGELKNQKDIDNAGALSKYSVNDKAIGFNF